MKRKKINTIFVIVLVAVAATVTIFIVNLKDEKQDFVSESSAPTFRKEGELVFLNSLATDTLATIDIELADNEQKTAQGLMYRTSMPQSAGMLFLMNTERTQGFWMKNTYISLDMIFVNSDMEIVTIHRNTTPMREDSYFSTAPALYVVEVNAGFTRSNDINEGDRIAFTIKK